MKVIAITGGGQGIGRGIAYHFARLGYGVSITDSDAAAGREAGAAMAEMGAQCLFVRGDVSRPSDVNRWLAQTVTKLGTPDVLVNNAGIMIRKDVLKLTPAEFDKVIAINLRGTFLCAQGAARAMAKRGHAKNGHGGVIINMASTRAFMSEPNTEGYTASKGGIFALTHGLAISLAPYRIRVNSISPGWIEVEDWKKSTKAKKPRHSKADREQHPAGRVGVPEDIAMACEYLAENAPFMTGQNIIVDGGMSVKMIYAGD
jgi:NAD(P)-dependent dehydrogenase (short-subunit alcohol dehydrogenase family)